MNARVLIVAVLLLAGCDDDKTITLPASEWVCTETVNEKEEHLMMVGKILVPYTDMQNVCVKMERRKP